MFHHSVLGVLLASLLLVMPVHAADGPGGAQVDVKPEAPSQIRVQWSYTADEPAQTGPDGPAPPHKLTAARTADGIRVDWTAAQAIVSDYVVRRDGMLLASTTGLNFTDPGGTDLNAYTVSSRSGNKEGRPSEPAFASSGDCVNIHQGAMPPVYVVPGTCIEQIAATYWMVMNSITVALPKQVRALFETLPTAGELPGFAPDDQATLPVQGGR